MPQRPPVHRHAGHRPQQQQRRETDRARYDRDRETRLFYMRAGWKRTRAAYLWDHPLCVVCETVFKRTTRATDCHHVRQPPYSSEQDFLAGPFESLCADCHREITAAIRLNRMPFHGVCGVDGWRIADKHADLWRRLGAPSS